MHRGARIRTDQALGRAADERMRMLCLGQIQTEIYASCAYRGARILFGLKVPGESIKLVVLRLLSNMRLQGFLILDAENIAR